MKPEIKFDFKHLITAGIVSASILLGSADQAESKIHEANIDTQSQTLTPENPPSTEFKEKIILDSEIPAEKNTDAQINSESIGKQEIPVQHVMEKNVETTIQNMQSGLAPVSCPDLVASALGEEGCAISFCESGWEILATGRSGERGWFQIHPIHFDSTYDPAGNLAAAVRLSGGGTDWRPWTTRSVLQTGICPNGRGAIPEDLYSSLFGKVSAY